jgi:hypothetical protein
MYIRGEQRIKTGKRPIFINQLAQFHRQDLLRQMPTRGDNKTIETVDDAIAKLEFAGYLAYCMKTLLPGILTTALSLLRALNIACQERLRCR